MGVQLDPKNTLVDDAGTYLPVEMPDKSTAKLYATDVASVGLDRFNTNHDAFISSAEMSAGVKTATPAQLKALSGLRIAETKVEDAEKDDAAHTAPIKRFGQGFAIAAVLTFLGVMVFPPAAILLLCTAGICALAATGCLLTNWIQHRHEDSARQEKITVAINEQEAARAANKQAWNDIVAAASPPSPMTGAFNLPK